MDAAKRLFGRADFRYYALADGIKPIVRGIGKGHLCSRGYKVLVPYNKTGVSTFTKLFPELHKNNL